MKEFFFAERHTRKVLVNPLGKDHLLILHLDTFKIYQQHLSALKKAKILAVLGKSLTYKCQATGIFCSDVKNANEFFTILPKGNNKLYR